MSAAIHHPEPIYAGDTWPGLPAITIRVATEGDPAPAAPPALPVASARLLFFKPGELPGGKAPATGCELPVTITSAAGWELAIPPVILPLAPGEWAFQLKTTDSAGTIRTWLTGTLQIL